MLPFQSKILKCTEIVGGWGSAPDPAGELTALPQTSRYSIDVMGYWYEIRGFTELLGMPGCVSDLSLLKIVIYIAPNASFSV